MIRDTNPKEPGSEQKPTNMHRRTVIGGAFAALLASSARVLAEEPGDEREAPSDPFILLLKGLYRPVPVGQGPADNLDLSTVNLNDGSYSKTKIYTVFGAPEHSDQDKAIGTFYVGNGLCAYDIPGGAIAMRFDKRPAGAPPGFQGFVPFPDGKGGNQLEGTFELTILEANGIYRAFQGGHNHMVDRLHQLANGNFVEFCFCIISTYQFP